MRVTIHRGTTVLSIFQGAKRAIVRDVRVSPLSHKMAFNLKLCDLIQPSRHYLTETFMSQNL